jgi:hypothetical protein
MVIKVVWLARQFLYASNATRAGKKVAEPCLLDKVQIPVASKMQILPYSIYHARCFSFARIALKFSRKTQIGLENWVKGARIRLQDA